ncbi:MULTISPECIES: DUF742 domain-containing protein [Streptomyces]|uniref:DUF742 domain-containing protein n=1 Tax=Streptomyces glycanivorans TaxID=3033808 RepID=A0ABY9JCV5_9ACTN|nr:MULTISPECIES: DUF742 domain-containing protein [unclassified Streptomyces]WSQ77331.1 DUF742 domain-containing protein [Streptomyces sp. NBC_01213]TXS18238.1 DUF742 domain-containing protein [Streptomyces sp. wa22]WLQ63942.1 DUF742 domain-containing protein [Streptomyces sp. Alt3]WSQ84662.1 DUF742 domain-containing protein [Streptomyces sp. NBC_01212]WSR09225.1 DUF742 domain-containing protein [Streptomyces sp. NBC_01208]
MAAPTGGHPYEGGQRVPGEQGESRYDTPSMPGRQGPQDPYQPYQQPYQPYQQTHQGAQDGDWQQHGSGWQQQQPPQYQQQPQHEQQPPQRYETPPSRIQPVQRQAPAPAKPAAHNPLVRPYAMTGGRTRPRYQLAIEALVSTTADPSRLQGQLPEHQRICRLCIEIKSVAEVSALLSIPLGVARILVADLAEAGLVAIHQPGGDEAAGGQPDVTLLERVLSGLRKL